jgi:hypothetical protein
MSFLKPLLHLTVQVIKIVVVAPADKADKRHSAKK